MCNIFFLYTHTPMLITVIILLLSVALDLYSFSDAFSLPNACVCGSIDYALPISLSHVVSIRGCLYASTLDREAEN